MPIHGYIQGCCKMNPNFADFREVGLDDRQIIQEYISRRNPMSCEQNYCNMYNWSPGYQYRWMVHEDRLIVRLDAEGLLLFPCGEYFPPEKLASLADVMLDHGLEGTVYDVPPEYLAAWPDYECYFAATTTEDSWDYIYSTAKLETLSGPKLRKKRNHISHFEREYPNWKVIPLTDETVIDFERFIARYYEGVPFQEMLDEDYLALEMALKFYAFTGTEGLALHNGEQVVAIAMFSRQNSETYTIHFEKSDLEVPGASQMINLQTARFLRERCRYINREQDMGIPGLRHAKRSYDPEFMLKNFTLERHR